MFVICYLLFFLLIFVWSLRSLNNASLTPWYVGNDTAERNERAKKAYSALLMVTARTPNNEAYRNFSVEVSKKATRKKSFQFLFYCYYLMHDGFFFSIFISHLKHTVLYICIFGSAINQSAYLIATIRYGSVRSCALG